jgi:hypothetical protein
MVHLESAPFLIFALCTPSTWLFLRSILLNKQVNCKQAVFLSSVSCFSKYFNPRREWKEPLLYNWFVRSAGDLEFVIDCV